jgi:lysophospholipid acyltransferase (LPLAT)-like uncharacterized protein
MIVKKLLGSFIANYLQAVRSTSSIIVDGPLVSVPHIAAFWHGQHFLAPLLWSPSQPFAILLAHGPYGDVYTEAFAKLGLKIIRGGTKNGGYQAFRQMVRELQSGTSIGLTVDTPKVARICGPGVISLARHSGRPIVPFAVTTSGRIVLHFRWDLSTINLPFSKAAVSVGKPIFVSRRNDPLYLEEKRLELQSALNALHAKVGLLVRPVPIRY